MKTTLIEQINKRNLIIITGSVGSGKKLLWHKLANDPQLGGKILNNNWQIDDLSTTGNIFFDEATLTNINYWEERDKINKIVQIASVAYHNNQKVFFCSSSSHLGNLCIAIREEADLFIKTEGVTKSWWTGNKSLQLTTREDNWEKNYTNHSLLLHPTDFIRLDRYDDKNREAFFKTKEQGQLETNHE